MKNDMPKCNCRIFYNKRGKVFVDYTPHCENFSYWVWTCYKDQLKKVPGVEHVPGTDRPIFETDPVTAKKIAGLALAQWGRCEVVINGESKEIRDLKHYQDDPKPDPSTTPETDISFKQLYKNFKNDHSSLPAPKKKPEAEPIRIKPLEVNSSQTQTSKNKLWNDPDQLALFTF